MQGSDPRHTPPSAGALERTHHRPLPHDEEDEALYDPLAGIDLDALHLDDIDEAQLEAPEPTFESPWRRVIVGTMLALMAAYLLYLPSTDYYKLQGEHTHWLFFVICGGCVTIGIVLGRWIWAWVVDSARRTALESIDKPWEPPKPPSALQRWATLLLAVGGAGVVIYITETNDIFSGGGQKYSEAWYLAAVLAVVVGFLAGRWIFLHASRPMDEDERAKPRVSIKLPPWVKWLNLVVLIGLGFVALFGSSFFGVSSGGSAVDDDFMFSGIGLVVAIGGAAWVARRFDEMDEKIRRERRPPR